MPRDFMTVDQPCVLCQQTLEVWTYSRDDLTGWVHVTVEAVDDHPAVCGGQEALRQELRRSTSRRTV
jgi:hypothetical protein